MNNNIEIQREQYVEIVVTQYDEHAINHQNLMLHQKLIMKHQSDNIHDHNAVVILTDNGKELGYMPKGYASIYAPAIDSGRYSFAVEIIKTEYDSERPILIVKINSELNNCSEEEVERKILQFVRNIVDEYSKRKTEYLKFIYSETVNTDELLASLNGVRLIQKLYAFSSDIITNDNIKQTTTEYFSCTKEALLKIIDELQADINGVIKKLRKSWMEYIDIDDNKGLDEIHEIRERTKKFHSYEELFTRYHESVEKYVFINIDSASDVETKTEIISDNSEPMTEKEVSNKSSNLTKTAFFDWLVSDGGVSKSTANVYISNIHQLEGLYQTLYGVKRNLLGAVSADDAKEMIEALVQRDEYNNTYNAALGKFAQFAGISVNKLKTQPVKKNYQPPVKSGTFVIKTVDFENPHNCTYYKPCSFIWNESKYPVKSWKELYTKFLQSLYKNNTYTEIMKSMIGKSLYGNKSDFEKRPYSLRQSIKVATNFYAEGNLSTIDVIKHIKCILELCSIDKDNMIIEYRTFENMAQINSAVVCTEDERDYKKIQINRLIFLLNHILKEQNDKSIEAISHQTESDVRNIVLNLNGNIIRAYDYSDALNKICEFAINYKPFIMARIAGHICIEGSNVFYRRAVPVDNCNKLSNGLQIKTIDTLTDLQTITYKIKEYCQIDDDMIAIISE